MRTILANLARVQTYQRERFPLIAHGLLVASFSSAAICFSANLRGATHLPATIVLDAGFISSLLFFFQMRVADEFKDAEDDATYRAYRPVPRGLVSLAELRNVAVIAATIMIAVAAATRPTLLVLLAPLYLWFGLMSAEFFAPTWLKTRPIIYLVSHMAIMPLIDLYISGFDWLRLGVQPPAELWWFLAVSFTNGIVLELGRKIRPPEGEETGVETYSGIWGYKRATVAWIIAMGVTELFALGAARAIGIERIDVILLTVILTASTTIAILFARQPTSALSKVIEGISGLWTLMMYLGLGTIPLVLKSMGR